MKPIKLIFSILILGFLASCSSVSVATDYDSEVDFSKYKTFAFFKPGIDEVQISDLDKRRILKAIEFELEQKGFTKSEDPDLLVNIFTEEQENVNVYQNNFGWGYGWGWGWGWGMPMTQVSRNVEGTLFIDFIDRNNNQLIWQGIGTDFLSLDREKKKEKIKEIVHKIIAQFPPKE
ncbi:MAG: DUF4136 domain-containing protein [Bacteroidota bacterium]